MSCRTSSLVVLVVLVIAAHPVAAHTKCFDFFPAPPFDEWESEREDALLINNYDEYLRCFKTAYHRAVVSCHPEYYLDNVHVLSPEEVERSIQEEKEELGEGDDERRGARHRVLPKSGGGSSGGGSSGGGSSGGGSCAHCPPEPIGGGGNSAVHINGMSGPSNRRLEGPPRHLRPSADASSRPFRAVRQDLEGCESRRRSKSSSISSRKKPFTSYLKELSDIMTECVRIHRETNNLFRDYLERGDGVKVRTCLMAEEERNSKKGEDD